MIDAALNLLVEDLFMFCAIMAPILTLLIVMVWMADYGLPWAERWWRRLTCRR